MPLPEVRQGHFYVAKPGYPPFPPGMSYKETQSTKDGKAEGWFALNLKNEAVYYRDHGDRLETRLQPVKEVEINDLDQVMAYQLTKPNYAFALLVRSTHGAGTIYHPMAQRDPTTPPHTPGQQGGGTIFHIL